MSDMWKPHKTYLMHFHTRAICEGVKHQSQTNAVFLLKVLCNTFLSALLVCFWQILRALDGWMYWRYINIDEALMTNKL